MANNNGKLSKPLSIAEVAQCLGSNSLDLGTLATDTRINKWSLHKPIQAPVWAELTEAQFYALNSGLEPPTENEYDDDTLRATWAYARPTGGNNSPYRLTDFVGYNHKAQVPVSVMITSQDGQLDGDGHVTRNPKIVASLSINDLAEIDIRETYLLRAEDTGLFVRMRFQRNGETVEVQYGLEDDGELTWPLSNLNTDGEIEISVNRTYDFAVGIIKRNGEIVGMDPTFGQNCLLGYVPYWKPASAVTGLTATMYLVVVDGASKPHLYVKATVKNTTSQSQDVTVQMWSEWFASSDTDNPREVYTFPQEVITVPAGATVEYVPDELEMGSGIYGSYGEVTDESGISDRGGVVYRYYIRAYKEGTGYYSADEAIEQLER